MHRVSLDDTIESICLRYNITRHRLLIDNPNFAELYPGCMLYIGNCNKKIYIVQPRDNICGIAQKLGKTEDDIRKLCGTSEVFIGQIIEYEDG